MASGLSLARNLPVRGMIVGFPGSGKTGSLAVLLNAGFKLRILDYDGNLSPLIQHADPKLLKNLDAVYLEDKMRIGNFGVEPVGVPTAYAEGYRLMDEWKYKDPHTEEEVNLGKSSEWGLDTIVVLDSLTKQGDASFRRARKMLNKTPLNTTDRVWNLAMDEQLSFISRFASATNTHHVLALAHLKIISPRDVRKEDSDLTVQLKRDIAELISPKYYPGALGWQLPQKIGGEFSLLMEARLESKAGRMVRTLNTIPRPELDLKFPGVTDLPAKVPASCGLLEVFKILSPASIELARKNLEVQ